MLPLVLLAQRAATWLHHGGDFTALLRANPHWITVQLQAVDALRDQPAAALWYLQQSPPVPNAVVAALLQVVPWPVGVGWALVAIQALCSLAVALLLAEVGRRLVPLWASTGLAVLWLLSPDVLVLETMGLGQTFYENLAALGVLACSWIFVRWTETGERRWALALGAVLGLLALTRSSYGYFSVYVLGLLTAAAWASRRFGLRQVAGCALVALSIQGGWAAKNLLVFGHWTWPASTWGGASLAASLAREPMAVGDELARFVLDHRSDEQHWFVSLVRDQGVDPWGESWRRQDHCPQEVLDADRRLAEAFHGQDRPANTQCLRVVSEAYGEAATAFLARHPGLLARRSKLAYATYWFPMRYHGGQYLGLFEVDWRVERPLRPWRSAGQLLAGELSEPVYVTVGTWPDVSRRPARLYAPGLPAVVWWLAEVAVLHLVTPVVAVALLWRLLWLSRRREESDRTDVGDWLVLALVAVFVYSAAVHNLVELRENMRFRWNVEPVIWLLVADSLRRLAGVAVRVAASTPPASVPR